MCGSYHSGGVLGLFLVLGFGLSLSQDLQAQGEETINERFVHSPSLIYLSFSFPLFSSLALLFLPFWTQYFKTIL